MNDTTLLSHLQTTFNIIDDQINAMERYHQEEQEKFNPDPADRVPLHYMRNKFGQPVLADLLVAKANVLAAITQLQLAEKAQIAAEDSSDSSTSTDGTLHYHGIPITDANKHEISGEFNIDWLLLNTRLEVARDTHKRLFYYPELDKLKFV